MNKITGDTTEGIVIIFMVLLGCLFLCQTLGKLIMWMIGRFNKTAFTGLDIIEELTDPDEEYKVKTLAFNPLPSFYSYSKNKNEFILGKRSKELNNMSADLYSLQSIAYANEQKHRIGMARWQYIGDAILSLVPYLFLIGIMLIVYLPGVSGDEWRVPKYNITVQVLCVVGWVVMLVCLFWWMSITQDMNEIVEDLAAKTNDPIFIGRLTNYLKYCSYIPFSYRTII